MGPKIPYLGILGLKFENNIVIFEISSLEFVKSEFLFHTMNFGKESIFAKGPGSVFSQGPGPGSCPLYKVCRD